MEDRRYRDKKKGIDRLILFEFILAFSSIYAIFCLYYETTENQQDLIIKSWGWISIILLLISSVELINKSGSFFNAYFIYIIVAYFYWLGSLFLKAWNLEPEKSVLLWFSSQELIQPVVYSVMGFGLMQLATILYTRKTPENTAFCHNITIKNIHYKNSVLITSIIFLIISTPVYYNELIGNAIQSITYGYGSLYVAKDSTSVSNIISSLRTFFVPGLYLLFSVKKESKIVRKFISIVVIVNVLLSFISGGRSEGFILILSFLWLNHVQIKPFKRNNIKALILTITLMLLSVTIIEYRGTTNKTVIVFFNLVINNIGKDNFIITFINELGYSIYPIIKTMQIVPQIQEISYGFSYLSSLLAIIPKLFLGGFSFAKYAALDIWLMNVLNLNYGPGFSLIAETYYNFGWFGLILMNIWGKVFVRIFSNKFEGDKAIVKNALIAIMLYYLLMTTRFPLLLTIRSVFYGVIIPILMINTLFVSKNKEQLIT